MKEALQRGRSMSLYTGICEEIRDVERNRMHTGLVVPLMEERRRGPDHGVSDLVSRGPVSHDTARPAALSPPPLELDGFSTDVLQSDSSSRLEMPR
jgi:hypothetical protein